MELGEQPVDGSPARARPARSGRTRQAHEPPDTAIGGDAQSVVGAGHVSIAAAINSAMIADDPVDA
jgi:hypothetical protein